MKISTIKLNDYLHFKKGLTLDLTYPKGHRKAGKPLDKICFLGQSGTGKTTLLNLIKYCTCEEGDYEKIGIDLDKLKKNCVEITYQVEDEIFSKIPNGTPYKFEGFEYSRKPSKRIDNFEVYLNKDIEPRIKNRSHILLNFPFCVVGPQYTAKEGAEDIQTKGIAKFDAPKGEIKDTDYKNRKIWDFSPSNIGFIWDIVFNKVSDYIIKYKERQIKLAEDTIENKTGVTRLRTEFESWVKKNPNPILELADKCLNPVLNHFSLEVETDIKKYPLESSTEKYIIIKGKNNGEEIKYPFLSTGTKQIMLTAIPLFFLKPSNTIVLFDQPETSLYPNIQWLLPNIYIDIAPKHNQFFFATHSPVVASSFEPWEVVELAFDDKTGEVYRKEYYDIKKPRTHTSYLINPKLLRWDSSYKKLFGLDRQGNEERISKLMDLAKLEKEIKKDKLSKRKKDKLVAEYMNLAALLDWNRN